MCFTSYQQNVSKKKKNRGNLETRNLLSHPVTTPYSISNNRWSSWSGPAGILLITCGKENNQSHLIFDHLCMKRTTLFCLWISKSIQQISVFISGSPMRRTRLLNLNVRCLNSSKLYWIYLLTERGQEIPTAGERRRCFDSPWTRRSSRLFSTKCQRYFNILH